MDAPHLLFVSGNNVRTVAEKLDHPRPILEQFPRQHNVTGSLRHRGFEFLSKRYETMALIAAPNIMLAAARTSPSHAVTASFAAADGRGGHIHTPFRHFF